MLTEPIRFEFPPIKLVIKLVGAEDGRARIVVSSGSDADGVYDLDAGGTLEITFDGTGHLS